MQANPLINIIKKREVSQIKGLYSVCSANDLVLRAAIRHAVTRRYPLIVESTSNQVNQFGGYTGMHPHEFMFQVKEIAREEGMSEENLILGGDHLGPLLWQHENESSAMEKAAQMVRAYTLAGFTKIHLDTSMKLADDPSGPLDPRVCARRGAILAKTVYESFAGMQGEPLRPALVIGSEVPIPGGQRNEGQKTGKSQAKEESVTPTSPADFLEQVSIYKDEFQKAGMDFCDVVAFVVQPGVEFGDDFVCHYDAQKAAPLKAALETVGGLVFEGHSTDYQCPEKLSEMVRDGVAILKVGPALTYVLREGLFLLEAIEGIIAPTGERSNFRETLLKEMNNSKQYWEKYYKGTNEEIEYKKLFSYSDRCRYYLPAEKVQKAIEQLLRNILIIPPALLSQFFPPQYRRFMAGKLPNDPLSVLYDRVGDLCDDYAGACGFLGAT